jgi:hypothetical protein
VGSNSFDRGLVLRQDHPLDEAEGAMEGAEGGWRDCGGDFSRPRTAINERHLVLRAGGRLKSPLQVAPKRRPYTSSL